MTNDWRVLEFVVPIQSASRSGSDNLRIDGTAINSCISRNLHKFVPEELKKAAASLRGKPLLKDHSALVDSIAGRVVSSQYDGASQSVKFSADVFDKKAQELISSGLLSTVSIGAHVQELEEGDDGVVTLRGIEFVELSLVAIPADPGATFGAAVTASYDLKKASEKKVEVVVVKKERVESVAELVAQRDELKKKLAEERLKASVKAKMVASSVSRSGVCSRTKLKGKCP